VDLTETIAPRSDQINADDLISGPVTVTIQEVVKGTAEQPVDVRLVEFPGRAYRPSKSMRRVMVMAWGSEAAVYAGRRLTLYRNPEITFGKDKVGGIEIGEMSHLDRPLTVALTATRGKRKSFSVKPLADLPPARDFLAEAHQAGGDVDLLRALYGAAQQAGAPQDTLNAIRALATPAPDEAPAS
jgi:hypothetical protein